MTYRKMFLFVIYILFNKLEHQTLLTTTNNYLSIIPKQDMTLQTENPAKSKMPGFSILLLMLFPSINAHHHTGYCSQSPKTMLFHKNSPFIPFLSNYHSILPLHYGNPQIRNILRNSFHPSSNKGAYFWH